MTDRRDTAALTVVARLLIAANGPADGLPKVIYGLYDISHNRFIATDKISESQRIIILFSVRKADIRLHKLHPCV